MSEGASPPPEHAPPAIGYRLKPLAQRQPLLTAGAIPPVVGAFPGKFRDVTPRALPLSEPKKDETLLNEDGTVETNYDEVIESFDDMGLKEDLLRGIYSYGFEKPSAIQQRAIKPLMMNRDTIAQAQSGTGKTATFTIGARRLCARARRRAPDARRVADADAAASSPPQASSRTSTRRSRTARR